MAIKRFKPITPGTRQKSVSTFTEVTTEKPERSLVVSISRTGGRNNNGRITVRHIGGGNRIKYRIIDYKSGSGTTTFSSIESLFNKEEKDRAKAVMQVFMYCWMYAHLTENKGKTIQPGIYYVRSLFADPFAPSVYHRIERGKSEKVEDFSGYAQAFEEGLRGCLDEIFNPEIPFTQTPTGKACSYCPFKGICGK